MDDDPAFNNGSMRSNTGSGVVVELFSEVARGDLGRCEGTGNILVHLDLSQEMNDEGTLPSMKVR